MGETRVASRILVGKPQKTPTSDNIKINRRNMGCEDGRWVELAESSFQLWALVFNYQVMLSVQKFLRF